MSEEATQRLASKDRRTHGGRGLAAFALLIALVGVGLAGYPYYRGIFRATAALDTQRAAGHDVADLRHALDTAVAGLEDRLQQQQIRQSARLDEQDARIEASMHSLSDADATAASTARLAKALDLTEAEYLLEGANNKLLLEGDSRGALAMMLAAQQILGKVDDPAALRIRAKLNDEVAALRADPGVDVNATYMRLETLKQSLPESPVHGVGFGATNLPAPADAVPLSLWQQAMRKFFSLFEFRRNTNDGRPPLTVDDVDRLRLNLELVLQTAQLALLRGDARVYADSLTTARGWLDDYRANNGDKVAKAQQEIDQLLAVELRRKLPDLSGSLSELRSLTAAAPATSPEATEPAASPGAAAAAPQ